MKEAITMFDNKSSGSLGILPAMDGERFPVLTTMSNKISTNRVEHGLLVFKQYANNDK